MKTLNKKQINLGAYLTAGLGAGCLAGNSDAAITVTEYGPGVTSLAAGGGGIMFVHSGPFDYVMSYDGGGGITKLRGGPNAFTRGADNSYVGGGVSGAFLDYAVSNGYVAGAVAGSQNYANIDFDGNGTWESVVQFSFNALSNSGYIVAMARNDNGSALSISAGKAAIDAVPEPSSLGLLALGAAGLLARRRRMVA